MSSVGEGSLTTGEKKVLMQSFSTFKPQRHRRFGKSDPAKKKAKKTNAVRKLFGVPDGDLLIDISASIKTCQMGLPGRMFIMDKYVLFYSDLFHVEQKVIIPKADISKINPDPSTNTVSFDISSQNTTFYFILSGRYKDDVMVFFKKEMDAAVLAERVAEQSHFSDSTESTASEDEDDEGLEWITTAAKEEGFLNSEHEKVVTAEFPISIKKFYDAFLKDETFFNSYHEHMGRTEINTGAWQSHADLGNIRSSSYRVKVNSPIGPPTSMMDETQRYYNQGGDANHIVLELTNYARDVKYGDSFRVESKFDIVGAGSKVKLEISVGVLFVKKIYIPGVASMIRSKTIEDCTSSYKQWVAYANQYIDSHPGMSSAGSRIKGTSTTNLRAPLDGTQSEKKETAPSAAAAPAAAPETVAKSASTAPAVAASYGGGFGFDLKTIILIVALLLVIFVEMQISSINKRIANLEVIASQAASTCNHQIGG